MILEDILFTQGFGTRHDCRAIARSGLVEIGGVVRDDPDEDFETEGLAFVVRGESFWPFPSPRATSARSSPPRIPPS